jgi:carbon storage regulator
MLILTRRIGETITVGNDGNVKFTVLDVNRRQVKIGIDAPREIAIHRDEIFQKILSNKSQKSDPEGAITK